MTKTNKPYTKIEVAFKNLDFNKVESRTLMPFGSVAPVAAIMKDAQGGSKWDITLTKNEAGYNDWTNATPFNGEVATTPQAAAQVGGARSYAPAGTTKSTYETPEERAQRQILIVRQSSLSSAINTLSVGSKSPPKVEDVLSVAREYESFVFGRGLGSINSTEEVSSGFEDMSDDVL